MSYQRAYALADRLRRDHRYNMARNRYTNFESFVVLYEIGLRNGLPVNQITAAIVSSGFAVSKAAYSLGASVYSAVTSQLSNKYAHGSLRLQNSKRT